MRLIVVAAAFFSVAVGGAAANTFVIEGRGWGHGVGMSQWGAEGLAAHGWEYRRILAHYYPHTSLERVAYVQVRVLVAEKRTRLSIGSKQPFRVIDRSGRSWRLHPGNYTVDRSLTFRRRGRRLSLRVPLRFDPGGAPLTLGRTGYRGSLHVSGGPGSLDAVNVVPLERYLRAVVPSEEPFYWNPQALAAQAVAARTYALANLKPAQAFDLFADARDQMYGGIPAERSSTNLAVGATAGQILTWQGRAAMALAYYCSTSGGRTQAVSDFRPDIPQVPYLVSVPDPYDSISPHHDWGPLRFSGAQLASIPAGAGRAVAARAVRRAREAGAPKVGVLLSSDYPSLQPGYYVVFSGRYARRSAAEAATRALRHRYPVAYLCSL